MSHWFAPPKVDWYSEGKSDLGFVQKISINILYENRFEKIENSLWRAMLRGFDIHLGKHENLIASS